VQMRYAGGVKRSLEWNSFSMRIRSTWYQWSHQRITDRFESSGRWLIASITPYETRCPTMRTPCHPFSSKVCRKEQRLVR
jgi:hypothetical protein